MYCKGYKLVAKACICMCIQHTTFPSTCQYAPALFLSAAPRRPAPFTAPAGTHPGNPRPADAPAHRQTGASLCPARAPVKPSRQHSAAGSAHVKGHAPQQHSPPALVVFAFYCGLAVMTRMPSIASAQPSGSAASVISAAISVGAATVRCPRRVNLV